MYALDYIYYIYIYTHLRLHLYVQTTMTRTPRASYHGFPLLGFQPRARRRPGPQKGSFWREPGRRAHATGLRRCSHSSLVPPAVMRLSEHVMSHVISDSGARASNLGHGAGLLLAEDVRCDRCSMHIACALLSLPAWVAPRPEISNTPGPEHLRNLRSLDATGRSPASTLEALRDHSTRDLPSSSA